MMPYIEKSYLTTQLNRNGDAHVIGLNVLDCVVWFEMNGLRWMVSLAGCVLGLLCVYQGLGYKNGGDSCTASRKR